MCASAAKIGRKCIRAESSSLVTVVARVVLREGVATTEDQLATLHQTVATLHQIVATPQATKRLLAHIPLQFQPTKRQFPLTLRQFQPTQHLYQLTQHLHQPIKHQLLLTQLRILGTRLLIQEPAVIKSRTRITTKNQAPPHQLPQPPLKPWFKNRRPTLQTLTARI